MEYQPSDFLFTSFGAQSDATFVILKTRKIRISCVDKPLLLDGKKHHSNKSMA